jgi:flagellar protein FliS
MKNPYLQVQTLELKTQIETASPHGLIDLLLQGARSNIAKAQGNVQRKQIKEKGEHIGKALGIIEGLKTSLNPEKGGEIAINLKQLYEHIQENLLQANRNNDEALLAHSNVLLAEIHEAWQGIR